MQTCNEPGCDQPAQKSHGRCKEHGRAKPAAPCPRPGEIVLNVSEEVATWLVSRPQGPAAWVESQVRQAMQGGGSTAPAGDVRAAVLAVLREQEAALAAAVAARVNGSAAPPVSTAAPAAPPEPPPDACTELLAQIEGRDPAAARRAAALTRYPQLVEAVARDLVSIARAEEMAQEADSRRR